MNWLLSIVLAVGATKIVLALLNEFHNPNKIYELEMLRIEHETKQFEILKNAEVKIALIDAAVNRARLAQRVAEQNSADYDNFRSYQL
jgi:hypothetical protein